MQPAARTNTSVFIYSRSLGLKVRDAKKRRVGSRERAEFKVILVKSIDSNRSLSFKGV